MVAAVVLSVDGMGCKDQFNVKNTYIRRCTWYDARSEYHTQLATKMSFDEIFDLTAGVYFYFHDIISYAYSFALTGQLSRRASPFLTGVVRTYVRTRHLA